MASVGLNNLTEIKSGEALLQLIWGQNKLFSGERAAERVHNQAVRNFA